MNKNFIGLAIIFFCTLVFFSYSITHAFFSNSAQSTNNTFTAAEVFPTTDQSITPTATPTATPTITPTPGATAGDVVINEINWAGNATSSADEWVELRNMTSSSIDLSGWVVENLGSSSTPNITIPSGTISANGFFLIVNFAETSASSVLNVHPDFITTSVSLANAGEQLRLKNSVSTLIDSANATTGAWFAGTATNPKSSMERNAIPGDGTLGTSWHSATTHVNVKPNVEEFATPKSVND